MGKRQEASTRQAEWEMLDFQSEAEWLAVKAVQAECPVAWEWFRRQLKRGLKAETDKALHNDGDISTRARGAACAFALVLREVDEINESLMEVRSE